MRIAIKTLCSVAAILRLLPSVALKGATGSNNLWQHETWNPIGIPTEMVEDEKGLLVTGFVTDAQNGDYRKMYQEGIITEHSVGFRTLNWQQEGDIRLITEVQLWEYSAVTWGANSNTPVVSKGEDMEDSKRRIKRRYEAVTKALRNGTYTDETFNLLEVELKYLTDNLLALIEPQESTQEPQFDIKLFNSYLKENG